MDPIRLIARGGQLDGRELGLFSASTEHSKPEEKIVWRYREEDLGITVLTYLRGQLTQAEDGAQVWNYHLDPEKTYREVGVVL